MKRGLWLRLAVLGVVVGLAATASVRRKQAKAVRLRAPVEAGPQRQPALSSADDVLVGLVGGRYWPKGW